MSGRPRMLFVIPSLRTGGAERVFTTLLNDFAGAGIDLHLAVLQREGRFFDELSPHVSVHDLAVRRSIHCCRRLLRLVRRVHPDVVCATSLRLNLVVTLLKPLLPTGTRVVIREVTALDALLGTGLRAAAVRQLVRFAYRRADAVICQSASLRSDLRRSCGIDFRQACVIPNPVDFDRIAARADAANPLGNAGPGPHVVAVGRLEPAKGFDRLIAAFPQLVRRQPAAQLWIVGDGRESPLLAAQAESFGIRDRVHFVGMQQNPYPWMRSADLLVLPSRREGLPNVLLEAIACQCPVVVLDHPGGTRDVMHDTGQEDRIVEDLAAWDDAWFERPSSLVRERARRLYDRPIVVEQYRRVLSGSDVPTTTQLPARQEPRTPDSATAARQRAAVRIAYITTIADTQWHFLRGQNPFLAERGFEIHAIAAPGPKLQQLAGRDGVSVHAVPLTRSIRPLQDLLAIWRMWRLLRRIRPHVVHVSTPKAALVGSIAAFLAGVPARLLLLRGLAHEGATGLRRALLRSADSLAARLCHRTLCVSTSLLELARSERILPLHAGRVPGSGMSNGIDAARFDPRSVRAASLSNTFTHESAEEPPVIGFVGRLARDKGLDLVAAAFARVRTEFPNARLLLVGGWDDEAPPPPNLRSRLEHDPHVHITGEVADPAPWLKVMSVFVFASRREGFPNAPMEAAAMELPVVATRATGTVDAVVPGVTGALVPHDDAGALADAIAQYLRSPELRRRHGRAGRQRVLREFQQDRVWHALLDQYIALLQDRGLPLPPAIPDLLQRAA